MKKNAPKQPEIRPGDASGVIKRIDELPAPPAVATKILNLAIDDECSVNEISQLIGLDQSLTLKVLKTANAPVYGLERKVSSIDQAVVILGLSTLKNILLGVVIRDTLLHDVRKDDAHLRAIWQHSLATAVGAQLLAERRYPALRDIAFPAGMIHDCGKVVLLTAMAEQYETVLEAQAESGESLLDLESRAFGLDHTIVGKRLGEKWQMPRTLVDVAWLHHQPVEALPAGPDRRLVLLVALASLLAHEVMLDRDTGDYSRTRAALLEELGFSEKEVDEVRSTLGKGYQERASVFDLENDSTQFYLLALQRAKTKLSAMNFDLERKNVSLKRSNRVLRTLNDVGLALGGVDDADQAFAVAASFLRDSFNVPSGFLYRLDRPSFRVEGVFWDRGGFHEASGMLASDFSPDFSKYYTDIPEDCRPYIASYPKRIPARSTAVKALGLGYQAPYSVASIVWDGVFLGEMFLNMDAERDGRDTEEFAGFLHVANLVAAALYRVDLQAELAERAERLTVAMRKMQSINLKLLQTERLASVGQLAAGAAHEINNPLAIVYARAQLLELKEQDPKKKKDIQQMKGQIERISSILRSLMDFARPTPPMFSTASVNDIVRKTLDLIQGGLDKNSVKLKVGLAEDLPEVSCDSNQMEQVILNLLINAEHAMEEKGGVLKVDTRPAKRHKPGVEIVVADTGIGIEDENLEKIFDPFFTTKEEGKGTGLGLSTSYGIMKSHQGDISVSSKVGRGTTVTLWLPMERDDSKRDFVFEQPAAPATQRGRTRILAVDDEEHIREILQESLTGAGYEVVTAANGQEGLEILGRESFSLMLLDIRMPQRGGLSLLSEVMDKTVDMPVVVITGMATPEELDEAVSLGAVRCIQKPFQVEELLDTVKEILER